MSSDEGYGTAATYPKLPAGRNLLSREYVDQYQRQRMMVAAAELAHEEGLAAVTVTGVTARARISRKTFYDYFANREECLEYAGEEAISYLFSPLKDRGSAESADARLATGVGALLDAVAAEPIVAEFGLIHAPALGGERGQRFQEAAIEAIARLVQTAGGGKGKSAPGTETIAIAILGVIAYWVRRGEADRVDELAAQVLRLARLPAVGVDKVAPTKPRKR